MSFFAQQQNIKLPCKDQFHFPASVSHKTSYFCGHSLGLQLKQTQDYIQRELDKWKHLAVLGYFQSETPWTALPGLIAAEVSALIGAETDETIVMNSLTVNLHLMLASFYRPTKQRYKILIEDHAFPSDRYAIQSQLQWHGFDPHADLIQLKPDPVSGLISLEAIESVLQQFGDQIALALLPGVQYYTGQVLDIAAIHPLLRRYDIVSGWDLAHAVGNVPLALHDWGIDFAVWCHYKYLNAGPGAVAGCFIHQRHASNKNQFRLQGWWGNDMQTRFLMQENFDPYPSAMGWQISCAPVMSLVPLQASLALIKQAGGIQALREASIPLTQYLIQQIQNNLSKQVQIITPTEPKYHGCQISIAFKQHDAKEICHQLLLQGVWVDYRTPNVIRIAPVPLYNDQADIDRLIECLATI